MKNVDLNKYKEFVKQVTSDESMSSMQMYNRMIDIETTESKMKVNTASLMTGAIGIASEGGELLKLLKNVSSKVNLWTMKLYFIVNENLAILCGTGLLVAGLLVWTLTK